MSAKTRVVAAMSGGVDSAVAAGLLVEAGYDVIGATMKMYEPTRPAGARSCCGTRDFDDARRSAAILGIPHYVLDFAETFRRDVVDRFADAYRSGRTPNPCVACNAFVKLGTLARYAAQLGATYVATGHYARLRHEAAGPRLSRAVDEEKDQSYALAIATRAQLDGLLLPLGEMTKTRTREHAVRLGLPVHAKPDSQEICFTEGGDYRDVLSARGVTSEPGPVVTTTGERVGTHGGVTGFTVGQRRGLPATHFDDGPRYVTRIEPSTGTIVIGRETELDSDELTAEDVVLHRPEAFVPGMRVRAMTRYRAPLADAVATIADGTLHLRFERPERAVAPGQLVALYDATGVDVLGAATIVGGR